MHNDIDDKIRAIADRIAEIEAKWEPRSMPACRVGRSSSQSGGVLGRVWRWLLLARHERFRVCALCGLVRDEDFARSGMPSGTRVCTGWIGEPYNRCMSAMTQSR